MPRCRGCSFALGSTAGCLSVEFYPLLFGRRMVPAAAFHGADAAGFCLSLLGSVPRRRPAILGAGLSLCLRIVRMLHGVPWRIVSNPARTPAIDGVLPSIGDRRGPGRFIRFHTRSTSLQALLRTSLEPRLAGLVICIRPQLRCNPVAYRNARQVVSHRPG